MSATLSPAPVHHPAPAPSGPRGTWLRWLGQTLPNLVVFLGLGGVFLLGHETGWKLPKLDELLNGHAASTAPADDWCAEHLVPESQCVECQADPKSKAKPFGFCREHGVAECVIHHPELAQVKGPPRLPKYDTAAAIGILPRPENNSRNTLHTKRIQFATPEAVTKAGIEVGVVLEQPMTDSLTALGELTFDPTQVAHLSPRVPGTVALVVKTLGDDVAPGDVLALVDAANVGQAKTTLLQSVVQMQLKKTTVERLRGVASSGVVAGKSLIEAESGVQDAEVAFVSARQALNNLGFDVPEKLDTFQSPQIANMLRFLGVPRELQNRLPAGTNTANLLPIRAPLGGMVVEADIVAGEVVDVADVLFTVADPHRLWLLLSLRQEDAPFVRPGLAVRFTPDDGHRGVDGRVSWISPAVTTQTRTLQVRVEVDNADLSLRDHTFGTGRIILRTEPQAIVVPRIAVQSTPDAHFVFVRDKQYFDKEHPQLLFHVRQVRLGARDGDAVELLAGVLPGEVVATQGSSVLMGQLLRSNLGEACGCHNH